MRLDADILIVGAGVGGATAAKELAKRGKKVLVVEKGNYVLPKHLGSEFLAFKFYDRCGLWSKSKEGVVYYRTIMAGGTSIVGCANAVRSLEKEFKRLGMDLTKEFRETEKELKVKPVPAKFLGPGTRAIMKAAEKLGFKMQPMPKMINFRKCVACGNCVVGCRIGAKWTPLEYLRQAQKNGATLMTGINVAKVLISKGRAVGVEGSNQSGKKVQIFANTIVLSAGGIGTPIILQNSKIKSGQKLFLDLFTVTMGLTKDKGLTKEVTMGAVNVNKGFLLSPFIDPPFALASVVPLPLRRNLRISLHRKRMLGIMVKIDDSFIGRVRRDGVIEKKATASDLSKLKKGANISKKILIEAGADPGSIITTNIRGAHPGGTAAIGEVVDKNLQTKIKGLYVCDASVLPKTPGMPPIVTIIALAKRFAKELAQ